MKKLLTLITVFVILAIAASTVLAEPKEKEPIDSVTLIHYIDGRVKLVGGGSCSKLLGVKWGSLPVSYVINPDGYDKHFVTKAISISSEEWDSQTSKELFNDVYSINYDIQWGINDGNNAYVFGSYSGNTNVIAVTRYWYTRYSKQIVDYDVLFNTYYTWKDCSPGTDCSKAMDLQTIALHETGHGVGLADVYNRACSDVVMYGYGYYGEVKRDLTPPDIVGLQKLYGA